MITIKEALDAGMSIEQVEREVEIAQAENWAPEQKVWSKLQKMNPQQFKKKLDQILMDWQLNEYSKKYSDINHYTASGQTTLNSKLLED